MASKGRIESLTEETICPICLDFFTDPVSPECGHNFCRSCITRCWEKEERNTCPQCKEEFADRTLRVNRALASLSEKFQGLTLIPKEKEIKFYCEEHEEELKLFCEADKKLICVMCAAAQEHREHRFLSIQEAVKIYKDRIKSSLGSLTKKKSDFEKMEQQQKEKISGVRLNRQMTTLIFNVFLHIPFALNIHTEAFGILLHIVCQRNISYSFSSLGFSIKCSPAFLMLLKHLI
ncbi:nuclear factor 7, brain-like [Hemitrygon akajei]|uniref:nuclear factor 7, brain-like n=1 Tax=Hemitrygon akajei TaxID=2704970 RepID=UPI003BF9DEA7